MRRALILLVLALPALARAQTATVTLSPQGQALATQLGLSPDDLTARIKSEVDSTFDLDNIAKFLRSFADATTFAQHGLGVDYMSVPGSFMLGVGGQVALATDGELTDNQRPTGGFAANFSVMVGVNLAEWGHPRWTLYASGFYDKGATDELRGAITTAAAHVQYRLIAPQVDKGVGAAVLRWTGLDVTTGVEFTRWSFGANGPLSSGFSVQDTPLSLTTSGTFDLASTAATVPIELTTGVRIVELLSLYTGVGFDVTAGKASVDSNLNGDVKASDGTGIATATITGGSTNTASPGNFRALAGVQLNLWSLKLFTQVNVAPEPAVASVAFGVRLVL